MSKGWVTFGLIEVSIQIARSLAPSLAQARETLRHGNNL